jgi:N-sulfoglucosamine sulfohydrolase
VDQGVGKLIELLKAQGKWDNTIVMYLSDNGIAFQGAKTNLYEPGVNLPFIIKDVNSKNKGSVSDALVSWVDITPTLLDFAEVHQEAEQALVESFKRFRTPAPVTGFHGKSLKPILSQKSEKVREQLLLSHTFHEITMYYPMRVVYHENYKLIFNIAHALPFPHATDLWKSSTWQAAMKSEAQTYGGKAIDSYTYRARFELYDLQQDPKELNNLASNRKYKTVLESMKVKLKQLQRQTNDPWAIKWEHE